MKDQRPICNCNLYKFPHKIGGKCTGRAFTDFYFTNVKECCIMYNCRNDLYGCCDVSAGAESISNAECFIEQKHYHPGEHLPLTIEDIFDFEEN